MWWISASTQVSSVLSITFCILSMHWSKLSQKNVIPFVSVVGDTCVAMDQWVQHPKAHTALDDILPCVDNATARETLDRSKLVTYQLVNLLDNAISNMTNRNFPPQARPLYYNQSGPLMPLLCNPFNADLSDKQCQPGEVHLNNATEVKLWFLHKILEFRIRILSYDLFWC